MRSFATATAAGLLVVLALTPTAHAANFVVNSGAFQPDAVINGTCAVMGSGNCTLRAAIQEANATPAADTITFSTAGPITISVAIPPITAPLMIDGPVGRIEINGNNLACFDFGSGATGTLAVPSGLNDLVIHNCNSNGVSLSGHGYTIANNRIGTNVAGTASDMTNDMNMGDGISLSGTIPPPPLPDINAIIADPPDTFAEIAAFIALIQALLNTDIAPPVIIDGNLISGNANDGIELFTPMTVNVQILGNIIGLNQSTTLALPNGRGGGDACGVRLGAQVYGNFVGPGNIISGHTETGDNGIVANTGEVLLPNFILGNLVGPGATQFIDVGNAESGIVADARPDITMPGVNPTPFSLFIGPFNTVSDNRGTDSTDLDTNNGDDAAGIYVSNSSGVRIFGNQIGAFSALGGVPILELNVGNASNGIIVANSPGVQIGGSTVPEANLILLNGKHGILLRGTQTNGTIIRGNFIGVPLTDPDLLNFANIGDGIHIDAAGSIQIGGTGSLDDNVIAGNGRHGIAMRNATSSQGWANHLERNQIYFNSGLGIDHNVFNSLRDPTDNVTPDADPNDTAYTNYGQNAPVLTGINGTLQYTLTTAPNRQYRIDLYQDATAGIDSSTAQARTWISQTMVTTNGAGTFTGSIAAPAGGGGFLTTTATDISPSADVPGPGTNGPHNNTSELSNALQLIEYTVNDPSVAEGNAGTTMLTFTVTRSASAGTGSVVVSTANDTATTADSDYAAIVSQTVNFADGQATAMVQVTVNGDTKFEPNETLFLNLSNPMNGVITDAQGIGTITNDDAVPTVSVNDVTLAEGTGGSTTAFTFTISLTNPSSQTVTLNAQSAIGVTNPATPGVDYTALALTPVTFVPGDTSENVTVLVNHDPDVEMDETFFVNLTGVTNATAGDVQGLGTITNDDSLVVPNATIGDVTLPEGTGGGPTVFTFTVTLSAVPSSPVTINYATADGTATTADADYAGEAQSIVITPPATTGQITIDVTHDAKFEANETFLVNLTGATNAVITDNQATGTINNDDTAPTFSVDDPSVTEGNSGTVMLQYTVTLSAASGLPASVDAASADGTATLADNDYAMLATTPLSFPAGTVQQTVNVQVNGDATNEPDETVLLNLGNAAGATIADGQGSGLIGNDDLEPEISVADASLSEGNSGSTNLGIVVTLSNPSSQTIQVGFATADGSATTANNDYANTTGMVTFMPGDVSETANVPVQGDTTNEPNETFFVNFTPPQTGASMMDTQAVGTILNDDALVGEFSITDVTAAEGNAGTTNFTFQVTRSSTLGVASVSVQSADGTATVADGDYTALPLTVVNFADGDASEDVTVLVTGDMKHEFNDQFTLTLSAPVNGTILDGTGIGQIDNDDAIPTANAAPVSQAEGNAGNTPFNFTVTLSQPSAFPLVVFVSTSDGSATVANNDYAPLSSTQLNFAPGDTSEPVTVNVVGDTTVEPDETFTLEMTAPSPATRPGPPAAGSKGIPGTTALGTIVNDDGVAQTFAINDVTLAEGNAGTTAFTFTVTRGGDTTAAASVTAQSAAGGGNPGTAGGVDFVDLAATTVNFAIGATTAQVTVQVVGETAIEGDETFVVNLTNASAGSITDPQGVGTITNDDFAAPPSYSINDVTLVEGNAGNTAFTFTITRAGDLSLASSVTAASAAGGANPATGGGVDFIDLAATVVNFAIDATTAQVTVQVVGEVAVETNETFVVNLSNAGNGTITDGQGVGTITNDDVSAGPTYAIGDVTLAEGNAGNTAFTFTITRGGDTTASSTVTAQSAAGTATGGGSDFADLGATVVNFAAGATTATVTVQVVGDTTFEPTEAFVVNLTNASAGAIIDAQATGTITNDDGQPSLSVQNATVTEGNVGTTPVTVSLNLSNPSSQTVTVSIAAIAVSADTGDFQVFGPITVTFPAGTLTQILTLNIIGDTLPEGTETLLVVLSGPNGLVIGNGSAIITILDDDSAVGQQAPATPVPALSTTMLAWLAALLALVGAAAMRRRRAA